MDQLDVVKEIVILNLIIATSYDYEQTTALKNHIQKLRNWLHGEK